MPAAIPFVIGALTVEAGIAAGATIIGGLMVAGGALTMIGAVTGNKYASRYGGYLSLAGGVAQIGSKLMEETAKTAAEQAASSATSEGAATALSESAAPVATDAAGSAAVDTAASQAGQEMASTAAQEGAANQGLVASEMNSGADALGTTPVDLNAPTVGSDTSFANNTAQRAAENQAVQSEWFKPVVGTEPSGLELTSTAGLESAPAEAGLLQTGDVTSTLKEPPVEPTWFDKTTSALQSAGQGIEKYKTAAMIGSGIIGGALSNSQKKAQAQAQAQAQVDAQLRLESERRKAYNASLANLALPKVTLNRKA